LGNKKAKDRIIKKIKKKDDSKNPLLDKKMGAPSNEERDLTDQQKEFGKLLGLGWDIKDVQKKLEFSDYQVKEYKKLPKIVDLIEEHKRLKNMDRVERYNSLWGDIETEALLELKRRIAGATDSPVSEKILMIIVNRTFMQYDKREDEEVEQITELKDKKVIKSNKKTKHETDKSLFDEEPEEKEETDE